MIVKREDKPIQGFAIYLEVAKPRVTQQVFLVPTGFDSLGRKVPESYFYRIMVAESKKSLWRSANTNTFKSDDKEETTYKRLSVLLAWLKIESPDYSIIGNKSLVIEVSKLDYDDIVNSKTPTKLIYRINQSRIGAGFPVEIVN